MGVNSWLCYAIQPLNHSTTPAIPTHRHSEGNARHSKVTGTDNSDTTARQETTHNTTPHNGRKMHDNTNSKVNRQADTSDWTATRYHLSRVVLYVDI